MRINQFLLEKEPEGPKTLLIRFSNFQFAVKEVHDGGIDSPFRDSKEIVISEKESIHQEKIHNLRVVPESGEVPVGPGSEVGRRPESG